MDRQSSRCRVVPAACGWVSSRAPSSRRPLRSRAHRREPRADASAGVIMIDLDRYRIDGKPAAPRLLDRGSQRMRIAPVIGIEPRRIEDVAHQQARPGRERSRVRSRCRRSAGRMSCGSTPTTNRSWHRAQARGGSPRPAPSGLPASKASTANELQANSFSAAVRPGSPQPGSIFGSTAVSRFSRCSADPRRR